MWSFFILFWTALMHASQNGNVPIIKLLLEHEEIDVFASDIHMHFLMMVSII